VNAFQVVWLTLFAAGGVVEIAALINRRRQDTLSEQAWILLGVFPKPVCRIDGNPVPCPEHGGTYGIRPAQSRRLAPGWVRVRRTVFVVFAAWLVLHFATGWV
jgi:hypothetical protein